MLGSTRNLKDIFSPKFQKQEFSPYRGISFMKNTPFEDPTVAYA